MSYRRPLMSARCSWDSLGFLQGDGGRQSEMDAKQVLVLGRKEDLLTQAINEEGHLSTYVLRSPARSGRARCRSAGAAARWRS